MCTTAQSKENICNMSFVSICNGLLVFCFLNQGSACMIIHVFDKWYPRGSQSEIILCLVKVWERAQQSISGLGRQLREENLGKKTHWVCVPDSRYLYKRPWSTGLLTLCIITMFSDTSTCSSDARWVFPLTSCLFISPQKRKRREKDDSDAVSLCSFDFKVKHIITHSVSLWVIYTPGLYSLNEKKCAF